MNIIETVLITRAHFSEEGSKRYLLEKTWDESKPKLAIIMLAPSIAEGISLDNTTLLVLNNASRLGYGSVSILNLFATLNDFELKHIEPEDIENLNVILANAETAHAVLYCPGVGKAKTKAFQQRQNQVLAALTPMEGKLFCLCDSNGTSRFQHPLSPSVRTWHLSPMKIAELLPRTTESSSNVSTSPNHETIAKPSKNSIGNSVKKKGAKA